MSTARFVIVEFQDRLQVIPSIWYNAATLSTIWPSHFKTKLRINKAIIKKEMPKEKSDWDELPIKKVIGFTDTYEEGLKKLKLAEDTSNVDTLVSSSELQKREQESKNRRRQKAARKHVSSSEDSDDSDLSSVKEKENNVPQNKILPALPQKRQFVSIENYQLPSTSKQNTKNVLCDNTSFNTVNSNDSYNNITISNVTRYTQNPTNNEHLDDTYDSDFKKNILWKLNKILYQLNNIENRVMGISQEKSYEFCNNPEIDNLFPICTMFDLISFEEKLEERKFQDNVLHFLKLVGGNTANIIIRNIFKKVLTDNVAKHFSWAGKKINEALKI